MDFFLFTELLSESKILAKKFVNENEALSKYEEISVNEIDDSEVTLKYNKKNYHELQINETKLVNQSRECLGDSGFDITAIDECFDEEVQILVQELRQTYAAGLPLVVSAISDFLCENIRWIQWTYYSWPTWLTEYWYSLALWYAFPPCTQLATWCIQWLPTLMGLYRFMWQLWFNPFFKPLADLVI